MNLRTFKLDALLLLTAAIWGFSFVAQRAGMRYIGPYTFNGVRFALGALSLFPVIYLRRRAVVSQPALIKRGVYSLLAGVVLFLAASLQQLGLVHTSAGKAGFITGLYVVLVPLSGLLWGQRTGWGRWLGACLAVVGLYFLSVSRGFHMAWGDLLVLLSALFWTAHVQILGWLSPKMDTIQLAALQFMVCSVLSLVTALATETILIESILAAAVPLLYGGLCSVGIAYTLQVVVQKTAHPAHAAIILSLEGVFAVLGGWLLLNEVLSPRSLLGCALMLSGMIASQSSLISNPFNPSSSKR
jgi:drug/metabolite transporter (DMT)-like permease